VDINRFNIFFEQHLFHALAKEKGIPINVLIEGIIEDRGYKYLGDFHDIPFNRTYLHLLGHFKKDEFTCIQMAAKLKELFPDYYDRIVYLFRKKNIRLSPSHFINNTNLFLKQIDEQSNSHLQRLKFVFKNNHYEDNIELYKRDFDVFYEQLMSILLTIDLNKNLYERDLAAQHWYRNLFADTFSTPNKYIVRCIETEIIISSFDWAGLFNKYYRIGADYYTNLQLKKGRFFNLIVLEESDNRFSLYDINEIEHSILLLLSKPLSIYELLYKMKIYFEEFVLQNYYEVYTELILASIKQLVIKKAIQPVTE